MCYYSKLSAKCSNPTRIILYVCIMRRIMVIYTVTYWHERTYLIYDVRRAFLIIKLLLSMPTRTAGTARDEYILLHGQIVEKHNAVNMRCTARAYNSRRWWHSTTRIIIIIIMKADRSQLARNNVESTDEITMTMILLLLCFYDEEIFARTCITTMLACPIKNNNLLLS